MFDKYNKIGVLSGSTLKIIACIFMVIDHIGLTFFPSNDIFRILGRIAFPLFAFFIAEGTRYSKHKLKRFLMIFLIGVVMFVFYYYYGGNLYGNIFLTFSLSIVVDQLFYFLKKQIFDKHNRIGSISLLILFSSALVGLYFLYDAIHFEYGYCGMLLPMLINITNFNGINASDNLKKLDCHISKLVFYIIGLIFVSINGNLGNLQFYCLIAVIPILFYNGKAGCRKMKYVFYIFYPAHLIIIEAISMLVTYFNN